MILMYTNLVNNNLFSQESTVSNLKELPKTYAILVEFNVISFCVKRETLLILNYIPTMLETPLNYV